jgi:crotonobetainyl-CoA:carnitine CoA-transferase CaiB-like acyl-CoA transferase
MNKPLAGVRVVEVSMWAFVPSAGALLADMGAEVVKIEPPEGDPMRALVTGRLSSTSDGLNIAWENYNRGKRSITLDLKVEGALEVLHRLLETADVFLTSLLPAARRRMGIDVEAICERHPKIIYAIGSGTGREGPDAEKGGFDAITYWSRGSASASVTPPESEYPLRMPAPAFGDLTSGNALAGGITAALYQRAVTGKASVVETSLLASSMWSMQASIVMATMHGIADLPQMPRIAIPNPLVNTYRTADDRFVSLCMLQGQRYWPGFCRAAGAEELATDERFEQNVARAANVEACVAEIDRVFARHTLAEWRERLATQDGQWDVVQQPGELASDVQVIANRYIQSVKHDDGRRLNMVSAPVQFDGAVLETRPAPDKGADSDAILAEHGYDEDQVIDIKVAGIVF